MGDPPGYFCHTKMINPTKELILDKQNSPQFRRSYEITYAKRPFEELYDIEVDPNCLENLAPYTEYNQVLNKLRAQLDATLKEQGDPRTIGNGAVFESYPYFGRMQPNLSGFKERGQYNPAFLPPGYPRIGPGP
jgi:hypothetical protein